MKPVLLTVLVPLLLCGCSSEESPTPAPPAAGGQAAVFQGFDTAPTPTRTVEPEYPESARKAGGSGTVHVEVLVDVAGSVQETRVVRSSGNEALDLAAEYAARQWEFSPATKDGEAVAARIVLPVKFALD